MKATSIAIASLLVVAGVAIVLMMSKSDPDSPTPTARAKPPTGSAGVSVTSSNDRPSLSPPPPTLGSGSGNDTATEYAVGDVKLRDHRSGSNVPRDIPPNPHPANARDIPAELTHAISHELNTQPDECDTADAH